MVFKFGLLIEFCRDILYIICFSVKWPRRPLFHLFIFLLYVVHVNFGISETWTSFAIEIQENYTQEYTYASCATCTTNTSWVGVSIHLCFCVLSFLNLPLFDFELVVFLFQNLCKSLSSAELFSHEFLLLPYVNFKKKNQSWT